jgi:hypothetical protein
MTYVPRAVERTARARVYARALVFCLVPLDYLVDYHLALDLHI